MLDFLHLAGDSNACRMKISPSGCHRFLKSLDAGNAEALLIYGSKIKGGFKNGTTITRFKA